MLKDTYPYRWNFLPRSVLCHSTTFDIEGNEWKEIAPLKEAKGDACGVSKNNE